MDQKDLSLLKTLNDRDILVYTFLEVQEIKKDFDILNALLKKHESKIQNLQDYKFKISAVVAIIFSLMLFLEYVLKVST